jgi:tripartite-type tricarboxylate transporter receptor subunit TctC
MRLVKILWVSLAAAMCMSAVSAQPAYPDPRRQIRVIVGFAAGGGADASARLITRKMGELMHTTFIIDNRGGAGGLVATAAEAEAKPDGYTLLWGSIGAFAFSPALGIPISFDPLHDFAPISVTASLSNVLVVGASSPNKTLADLIAAARANPGKLSFGTPGIGSAGHISAQLLLNLAKLDMVHVPYRGGSQLATDVISGNVSAGVVTVSTVQTLGKDTLVPLAVTTAQRDPALPNVPTFAEAGVKGYEANFWFGLLAPKGTPRAVVDKLNAAVRAALADPAVSKAHLALGFSGTGSTPEEFARIIDSDYHKWGTVLSKERGKN